MKALVVFARNALHASSRDYDSMPRHQDRTQGYRRSEHIPLINVDSFYRAVRHAFSPFFFFNKARTSQAQAELPSPRPPAAPRLRRCSCRRKLARGFAGLAGISSFSWRWDQCLFLGDQCLFPEIRAFSRGSAPGPIPLIPAG